MRPRTAGLLALSGLALGACFPFIFDTGSLVQCVTNSDCEVGTICYPNGMCDAGSPASGSSSGGSPASSRGSTATTGSSGSPSSSSGSSGTTPGASSSSSGGTSSTGSSSSGSSSSGSSSGAVCAQTLNSVFCGNDAGADDALGCVSEGACFLDFKNAGQDVQECCLAPGQQCGDEATGEESGCCNGECDDAGLCAIASTLPCVCPADCSNFNCKNGSCTPAPPGYPCSVPGDCASGNCAVQSLASGEPSYCN